MKNLLFLFSMMLLLAACGNTNQTSEKSTEDQMPANLVELKLDVKGMTCEGCENAIIRSLDNLEGVYESNASHQEELVVVKYDPDAVSVDQISATITKTGYTVAGELEQD
jgi:copper chaperone CopZ